MSTPKNEFELKAINGKGYYDVPDGPIFSWNDFSSFFCSEVKNSHDFGFYNQPSVKEAYNLGRDTNTSLTVHMSGNDKTHTPIGVFYEVLSRELKAAIYDGKIALLKRPNVRSEQDESEETYTLDLPEGLRTQSRQGYLISSKDMLFLISEICARKVKRPNKFQMGAVHFVEMFNRAIQNIPNYSDVKPIPVNNPIPHDKIKNRMLMEDIVSTICVDASGDFVSPSTKHGVKGL